MNLNLYTKNMMLQNYINYKYFYYINLWCNIDYVNNIDFGDIYYLILNVYILNIL